MTGKSNGNKNSNDNDDDDNSVYIIIFSDGKNSVSSKGIQDSLGFRIPHCRFQIRGTGFQYLSVELGF